MKKLLIIFSLFLFCSSAFADIIVTTSNQRIVCKIVKSDNKYVYYQIDSNGTKQINNKKIVSISISNSNTDSSSTSYETSASNSSKTNSEDLVGNYSGQWTQQDFYYFAYLQYKGLLDPYFYQSMTTEEKNLMYKYRRQCTTKELEQRSQGHSQQAESAVRQKSTTNTQGSKNNK